MGTQIKCIPEEEEEAEESHTVIPVCFLFFLLLEFRP